MPPWLIPMVYVGVTVVCALVLPRLEHIYLSAYSQGMSVASSQAVLSAIASGMMALTGIVFALAFVMVQFSAVAYSPRLVAWFALDPLPFHALGRFTATFVYALATLAWIDRGGNGKVPLFSILLVTLLLILSMIMFARLVQRINDLQIANVLQFIGHKGRIVILATFPRLDATPESWSNATEEAQRRPVTQRLHYSGEPLTIASFDHDALVRHAQAVDGVIVMDCAIGDTLVEEAWLLRVHGGQRPLAETALRQAIQLAKERTFDQDPKYALRLLVDIAIKALSPAINDPTTAVQAMSQIEDLLRRLGRRALDAGCVRNGQGVLRLVFPTPTWEDYLTLAFDEIRQYGADSVQVMRRLRSALLGLTDSERKQLVLHYLQHLDQTIAHSRLDAEDQGVAYQEDQQGLGLSRHRSQSVISSGYAERI